MLTMTAPALSRLVLVGPTRDQDDKVRRYRLARLKLDGETRSRSESPYAHLKRLYD
jgi:hypothetical protein